MAIFGLVLLTSVPMLLLSYLLAIVLEQPMTLDQLRVQRCMVLLCQLFLGSFNAVVPAVAYHDLRKAKEGLGIEELAKVFD